jgi:glycosyltransferase involved in cell wall biosynthesis
MEPKVTVLTTIYNGRAYLNEAIESVLNQTYSDFEFLIIDDTSTG